MNPESTQPVALRYIELSDAPFIHRYASEERIAATSNVPHPYPDGAAEEFVRGAIADRHAGTRIVFAILHHGECAGVMTLNSVDGDTASLDYWVAAPLWGRGIATAAAALAIQYAFHTLNLRRLHSACLARNPASSRVLEKSGFRPTGTRIYQGGGGPKFVGELLCTYVLDRPSAQP